MIVLAAILLGACRDAVAPDYARFAGAYAIAEVNRSTLPVSFSETVGLVTIQRGALVLHSEGTFVDSLMYHVFKASLWDEDRTLVRTGTWHGALTPFGVEIILEMPSEPLFQQRIMPVTGGLATRFMSAELVYVPQNASIALSGMKSNGIVEAVRPALRYNAAGENSYRSSVVKVLDGPAA